MITNRMQKLRSRRTDMTLKAAAFDEAYDRIQEDETIRYAIGTMQPIDKKYTDNTYAEGDRIKNQLDKVLNSPSSQAEFRYQGSVSNDTHIKIYSDLDLLVIHTDFETVEPPAKPQVLYKGDALAELKKLRKNCASILKEAFPMVIVDDSPGKCIALSGGSLRREIDVVIANWWNTVAFQQYDLEIFRGVKVLDTASDTRHENKPFWHNYRINDKDVERSGNLRKVIRLLKSLKYDADDELEISSYDITAIAWNMPDQYLTIGPGQELLLVENARIYLHSLLDNNLLRDTLMVPNGTRTVFGSGGATKNELLYLCSEVTDLSNQIKKALLESYRNVKDSRVYH